MSLTEIQAALPALTPEERTKLWNALWSLEERDLFGAAAPTAEEKRVLDQELDDYRKNPQAGSPWTEVDARLRQRP